MFLSLILWVGSGNRPGFDSEPTAAVAPFLVVVRRELEVVGEQAVDDRAVPNSPGYVSVLALPAVGKAEVKRKGGGGWRGLLERGKKKKRALLGIELGGIQDVKTSLI